MIPPPEEVFLLPRRKKLSFEKVFKEIMDIDEDDVFEEDLTLFLLTGEPPDGPDEELDPEGYRENLERWRGLAELYREEAEERRREFERRSRAARRAWETRRKRYGKSGRR